MIEIPFAWRPRLRTVLLAVIVLVLLLPLAGIVAVRQYENELVRSTEAQLLVQGVFAREIFLEAYGSPPPPEPGPPDPEVDALEPILDLGRDAVLPRAPEAALAPVPADPAALAAGRSIEPRLRSAARQSLAGIRVVDRNGIVVATTGTEAGLSLVERVEVREALAGRTASVLRERNPDEPVPPLASSSRGGRYRVFVALPLYAGDRVVGAVVLSRTPLDIVKALWIRRGPLLVAAGMTLAVALLVAATTALFIGRPVALLIDQARRVARGERGAAREIRGAGTREMRALSRALAEMARTVEHREAYIRTFASHVSHEFKTPLTTIRGAVELLGDSRAGEDRAERAALLERALAATERLQRLVEGLLALARADAAPKTRDTTDVARQVERLVERFRDLGLAVSTSSEIEDGMEARIPAEALDAILSHLLENARAHGASRARVDIRTSDVCPDPTLVLEVADDGPGISEANAEKIFDPFFTTARDRGGTGLGLSIARALAQSHGGTLDLDRRVPGASFRLGLPATRGAPSPKPVA